MPITINGNTESLDQAVTVAERLAIRGLTGKRLATAFNGEKLSGSQYGQYTRRDGDVLEDAPIGSRPGVRHPVTIRVL